MAIGRKIRLVQAFAGAIILTLLMMPMGILGFGQYIWMLFLPLLLFFALGAQFKVIPSMLVCYICGVVWAHFNGILQGVISSFLPLSIAELIATIITIFLVLTVHENFLAKTIFGNIPALFLGMCTTFFMFMSKATITPFHLIGFFFYGIFLSVVLVMGGFTICSAIFGKQEVVKLFVESDK